MSSGTETDSLKHGYCSPTAVAMSLQHSPHHWCCNTITASLPLQHRHFSTAVVTVLLLRRLYGCNSNGVTPTRSLQQCYYSKSPPHWYILSLIPCMCNFLWVQLSSPLIISSLFPSHPSAVPLLPLSSITIIFHLGLLLTLDHLSSLPHPSLTSRLPYNHHTTSPSLLSFSHQTMALTGSPSVSFAAQATKTGRCKGRFWGAEREAVVC